MNALTLRFEKFYDSINPEQANPSQKLSHFLRETEEKTAFILIRFFGWLQADRIKQAESSLSDLYDIQLVNVTKDFSLTLQHNLQNLKDQKCFAPLPLSELSQYSWDKKTYFNTATDLEFATLNATNYLLSAPMPLETAKALSLDPVIFLQKHLDNKISKMDERISFIFRELQDPHVDLHDALTKEFDHKFIPLQRMMLKYAASTDYPKFTSWLDEILCWSSSFLSADQVHEKMSPVIKQFKFCCLVGMTSKDILPAPQVPVKTTFKFNSSFQHYLIQKTLGQIQSYCPLPIAVLDELAKIFVKSDAKRRLTSFYLYTLKGMFGDAKNPLIELINLAQPTPEESLLNRALNLLKRLIQDEKSITYKILSCVTYVCYTDCLSPSNQLTLKGKRFLFQSIFNQLQNSRSSASKLPFLLELCPFSLFYKIWLAINKTADTPKIRDRIIAYLRGVIFLYKRQNYQNLFEIGLEKLRQSIDAQEYGGVYPLLELFSSFIHFSCYVNLNEENKELLFNHLQRSNAEERKACLEELKKYLESLDSPLRAMIYTSMADNFISQLIRSRKT